MPLTPQYIDPNRPGTTTGPRENLTASELAQIKAGSGSNASGGGAQDSAPAPTAPKKKKKKKRPQRQQPAPYNPFTERFKTPGELRAEAARLAALSAPSEEFLREQQAREEAGLTGLTGELTGRVQQYVGQTGAGLAGLGSLYGNVVGQARTAAESAAAAAGAAPGVVTPAQPSESVTSQLANIGRALLGFVPAAATTGAQLRGASKQSLSKALADRASQISENTAKYLQQLQGIEYEKAVAQETARQNAARLGLSADELAFEQALAGEKLGIEREKLAQGWYRAETARAKAERSGNKNTDARNAKQAILKDIDKWTAASSTLGEYDVSVELPVEGVKTVTVQAPSAEAAIQTARQQYPDTFGSTTLTLNPLYRGPAPGASRAAESVWRARIRNYLMVAGGMSRKNADAFINSRVKPLVM